MDERVVKRSVDARNTEHELAFSNLRAECDGLLLGGDFDLLGGLHNVTSISCLMHPSTYGSFVDNSNAPNGPYGL